MRGQAVLQKGRVSAAGRLSVTHTRHTRNRYVPRRNALISTRICRRAAEKSDFDLDKGPEGLPGMMELGPREDDVLPDSLADAIADAAEATNLAISRSNSRCQVEILLPEFWDPISGPIFPNKGDQERFWRMTRRFVEKMSEACQVDKVKVIYPDAGVAAMLSHQWQDASFSIASLNDRRPMIAEDEMFIIACPDPFAADDVRRIVRLIVDQDEAQGMPERPIVLFNQRLSSGDVGIGLNARRLRDQFLTSFVVSYSLRPVGEIGTVFRRYPENWKVFVEEEELPGRYRLVADQPSRPAGEMLDYIIDKAINPGQEGATEDKNAGLVSTLRSTMKSLNYFMKSLQK